MKLLLINPYDRSTCAYSTHFPPLSIGYIAALTPPSWELEFIDENFEAFVPRKADLVAITTMTIQANRAYEISRVYREMGVPVILGGIHPSMVPEEALNYANSVVIGEAESLWPSVLDDFLNGELRQVSKAVPTHLFKTWSFPGETSSVRNTGSTASRHLADVPSIAIFALFLLLMGEHIDCGLWRKC